MNNTRKVFKDKNAVAKQFAEDLLQWTKGRKKTTVALSGGSTPKLLFQILAEEYLHQLDWSTIHFFWGDERCVPPDDKDSNYKMTYDLLLKYIPEDQRNVYRVRGEDEPTSEAIRYAKVIEEVVPQVDGLPQFDIMILGMGEDGHTASIFPDQMELLSSEGICAIARHPDSGQIRVTLTGRVINNADKIAFLVTGEGKAEKVAEILEKKGSYLDYPAAHIDDKAMWYLDESAANDL